MFFFSFFPQKQQLLSSFDHLTAMTGDSAGTGDNQGMSGESTTIDEREIDTKERETIEAYLREGCGCSKSCHSLFDEQTLVRMRSDCAELNRDQLDFLVIGHLLGSVIDSQETSVNKHLPKSRARNSCKFFYRGKQVRSIKYKENKYKIKSLVNIDMP